jgi:hypothetical protein
MRASSTTDTAGNAAQGYSTGLALGVGVYHDTTPTTTSTTTTTAAPADSQCTGVKYADLVFVLDSSSSLGADNWDLVKQFAANVVSQLTISSTANRYTLRHLRAFCIGNVSTLHH